MRKRPISRFTGKPKFDQAIIALDNHLIISSKSVSTRRNYNRAIYKFIQYADKLPEECTKNEIVGFMLAFQNGGCKAATLKNYVYAIKYYLKNVVDRLDLFDKIPVPKVKEYDVEILNIWEMNLLIESCQTIRDKFIIQLLYETGIRIKELLSLDFHDFDLHHRSLTIRNSKNGRTRTVYFGENMLETIKKYHRYNCSLFSNSSLHNSRFHPFIPFSKSCVRDLLKNTVKKCGITKHVSPHLLRHAFAVHYLNFGGTIYQLQKLLGHQNLITTFHYLQYAVLPENQNISILDKLLEVKEQEELSF